MKKALYFIISLSIISSCKKDITTTKQDSTTAAVKHVNDSVSFVIDGKTYTANQSGIVVPSGNQDANKKIIFDNNTPNSPFSIKADADSILFFRESSVSSNGTNFIVSFAKKYNKKQLTANVVKLLNPTAAEIINLYAVGNHQYAEDFGRDNTQNGIALSIIAGKGYSTAMPVLIQDQTSLKKGFQKNSTFNIISLTKTQNRGYNLVANFSAVIVDQYETQHKLESGYLRLFIDPIL